MSAPRPVTIVGGGLAGLVLGIGLRQRGVPVTLWEGGKYPRHRVCGEFVQGRGCGVLSEMGLMPRLRSAGAREASSATFFSGDQQGPVRALPDPALCLSRYRFDAILAEEFRSLGGTLREGERWNGDAAAEGVVMASGRRLQATVDGWRWFGLKAHALRVEMSADLEMHLAPDGYVGLCRVEEGRVNVCGLFRRNDSGGDPAVGWRSRLRGLPGSALHDRLSAAQWVEDTACAVAGLDLRPQLAGVSGECRIGDALTMIPPFTGNGMSMAIESAGLSVDSLSQWSSGERDWMSAVSAVSSRCGEAFSTRLAWAQPLHRALFSPVLQKVLVQQALRSGAVWRFLLAKTR